MDLFMFLFDYLALLVLDENRMGRWRYAAGPFLLVGIPTPNPGPNPLPCQRRAPTRVQSILYSSPTPTNHTRNQPVLFFIYVANIRPQNDA